MAHSVFICHSSQDKQVADAACAALEAQRISCWIAPRDILAGEEYGKSIVDALASCRIVLLVFSAHANGSPQVRREIERAVSKGKIIVPFRIEDVLPSDAMEFALSNTHWLDALTPPMERYLLQLCDTIARLIQKHTVAETPLWRPPEPVVEKAAVKPAPISEEVHATPKPAAKPAPEPADLRTSQAESDSTSSGWRRLPGWAWGALAVVVLFGVFAMGRLFGPGSKPQPSQPAVPQPASSPGTNSTPASAPASGPSAVPAQPAVAQQPGPAPAVNSNPAVQKPNLAEMVLQGNRLYSQGLYAQAAALYSQACNGGNAAGCGCLGTLYENGTGVAQNYPRALTLYSKACDGGVGAGCSDAGNLYRLGHGAAQDLNKARQLFTEGCKMGLPYICDELKQMQ